MVVNIIGPVIISFNHAHTAMFFNKCDIKFYKNITYKSNNCIEEVMYLKYSYNKIFEYSNITLLKNQFGYRLICVQIDDDLNPPCLFQFASLRNFKTVSSTHYSVNIIDNYYVAHRLVMNLPKKVCLFPFYHLTPNCKWIPTTAFHDDSPKEIYQQILKISNQNFTYHKICHCLKNKNIDFSVDTLGPIYPAWTVVTS